MAGVQLLKPLIYLEWVGELWSGGWGSTSKTPDILVTVPKMGFEQAISGVFTFKKSQAGSVFPRVLPH